MTQEQCPGRITKEEGFTFGDGITPFYIEYRCENEATSCKDFHESMITEVYPENNQRIIFSPTKVCIKAMKRLGPPPLPILKKAIDAHNKVMDSLRMRSQEKENPITYYETDETATVTEIRTVNLTATKKGKRTLYKDPILGLLFERLANGSYVVVQEIKKIKKPIIRSQPTTATNGEIGAPESH